VTCKGQQIARREASEKFWVSPAWVGACAKRVQLGDGRCG